jgi:hypothetical protein
VAISTISPTRPCGLIRRRLGLGHSGNARFGDHLDGFLLDELDGLVVRDPASGGRLEPGDRRHHTSVELLEPLHPRDLGGHRTGRDLGGLETRQLAYGRGVLAPAQISQIVGRDLAETRRHPPQGIVDGVMPGS